MLYNAVRGNLLALFNWAIEQGLTESNPVVGTIKYEDTSRERVLSLPELAAIWHAVDDIRVDHHLRTFDHAAAVRLLMLTGQREGEIGYLRWREIVGDTIVLPGERTKNKREHTIPLSKPAQTILLSRPRGIDDEAVLRFRGHDGPFTGWSWCKVRLDRALIMRGHTLAHWVYHDLRRSVATHMGEMGIQPHVIEAVLNHASGSRAGIAGVYNRSKLEEPKRQALVAWADLLMMHVEGRAPTSDKIVSLAELKGTLGR
jgi:integrase